jgi:hypothetical protein
MPSLHYVNGICQGGAWKACGLDDHQHPIKVKHDCSLGAIRRSGKEVPTWRVGQDLASKEVTNSLMVWSDISSDDEKIGCTLIERRIIKATIKGRMVENALNNMVDNDNIEGPYLLPTIEVGDYGY